MSRLVVINDCENCPFVWLYLGTTECCILKDKRRCHKEEEMELVNHVPSWCPLPKAAIGDIEIQNFIKNKSGYVEE
jgi:uncharacterized protein (DUF1919 family)